jgi:hypothetical protein
MPPYSNLKLTRRRLASRYLLAVIIAFIFLAPIIPRRLMADYGMPADQFVNVSLTFWAFGFGGTVIAHGWGVGANNTYRYSVCDLRDLDSAWLKIIPVLTSCSRGQAYCH